jgi:UDP-3-O-[3-hydroxymyristoyl] glucosamine N-acyltransferase
LASSGGEYEPAGFVENWDRDRCHERLNGLPIHWIDDIADLAKDHWAVCSLATTKRDKFIEQVAALRVPFATLVHSTAHVSAMSSLGEGTFLSPGVVIGTKSCLGRHVRVNRGAMIGHHTRIGDYVTIQPGVHIAGFCEVGDFAYLGIRATVIERVKLGAHSVV